MLLILTSDCKAIVFIYFQRLEWEYDQLDRTRSIWGTHSSGPTVSSL